MLFHHVRADVRYALKWLARSPAFTAVAVGSLAIGIGFNTALFSVIDALLLRPMAAEPPDRLVDVYTRSGDGDTYATSSYPDFVDFRTLNEVFSDMLAYSPALAAVKTSTQAASRMALGEVVTGNYFQVLGVNAAIGRTLLPEDDRPGATRVVVLSDRAWTRDHARDPRIVGRTIQIHGQPYTIVGVAPPRFTGMLPMLQPELWMPLAWVDEIEPAGVQDTTPSPTGKTRLERRGQRWMFIKARLKDSETFQRAQANMQIVMQRLAKDYPQTNDKRPVALAPNVRVHPDADRALRPVAAGLMLGVGLVLLVACANVANMLLARASGRQREIGIRLAIGASRGRLIRQLLTEGLVLGAVGAAAGVAVGAAMLRLIRAIPLPIPVPLALSLHIDARVLLFTTVIAMLAGVIAYAVARRTREIGIRMALGAAPSRVISMVMRQGLSVAGTGVAIGLLLSWPAARAISAALYGVSAIDPAAWAGAVGVLLGSAALANYLPARRAARVDPSTALRIE